MKILYVVEPMLGIGPNIDANLIAKIVSRKFNKEINIKIVLEKDAFSREEASNVSWEYLIPWRLDFINNKLINLSGKELTNKDKQERIYSLLNICKVYKPDVLILHNYMSGSPWDSIIDFEMIPLIDFARSENNKIKVYSYMIGMLDGFENITRAEELFFLDNVKKNMDKVFLRSDNLSLFIKTCPPAKYIQDHFVPVGYSADEDLPKKIVLSNDKYIVVSAGGGDIALNLFINSIKTCAILSNDNNLNNVKWKIFLGPMQEKNNNLLKKIITDLNCVDRIELITGADETVFLSYLMYNCLVSISQCGQRTFTNLEVTGVNSILIPRESDGKEFEQLYRAIYMEKISRARLIREKYLSPENLALNLKEVYNNIPKRLGLKMNGPENLINNILNLSKNEHNNK